MGQAHTQSKRPRSATKRRAAPAERTPAQKAEAILALLKQGGEAYTEAERLLQQLLPQYAPQPGQRCGPPIPLSETQVFRIVDPFIDAKTGEPTKLWKHSPVQRFAHETGTL